MSIVCVINRRYQKIDVKVGYFDEQIIKTVNKTSVKSNIGCSSDRWDKKLSLREAFESIRASIDDGCTTKNVVLDSVLIPQKFSQVLLCLKEEPP